MLILTASYMKQINNLELLASAIQQANTFFQDKAQRQVNKYLTLRNWVIGYYIVEYEQHGKDRAEYGNKVLDNLVSRLKNRNEGLSKSNLKLFRTFYVNYPQIIQTVSEQLQATELQLLRIGQTVSGQLNSKKRSTKSTLKINPISVDDLINKLGFSHFVEIMGLRFPDQRNFYEKYVIETGCSVRELRRVIDSMLHNRSTSIKNDNSRIESPLNIIKDPYVLEFLNLKEDPKLVESDLEQRIIEHLQNFLLELGKGFCFEARQKRISISNTHFYIDLVFYHRILKCHILIELKTNKFSPGDAGQMNLYVNYYKDNEMAEDDNPPIGIILCTEKEDTVVRYATTGMNDVFVSRYLSALPTEEQLKTIIEEEKQKMLNEMKGLAI